MGPFGKAAAGLIASKDDARKELSDSGRFKHRKRSEDNDMGRRNSTKFFRWNKNGNANKRGIEKKENGRQVSAPGKIQNVTDSMPKSSTFLDVEYGLGLGLNRIKTRSGPIFAGTLDSRFNVRNVIKEDLFVKSSPMGGPSSRPLSFWIPSRPAKVHTRDSDCPETLTSVEADSRQARSRIGQSRKLQSSLATEGSSGPQFDVKLRGSSGSAKWMEKRIPDSCATPGGEMVSSVQIRQAMSNSSLEDESCFSGRCTTMEGPVVLVQGSNPPGGIVPFPEDSFGDRKTTCRPPGTDGEGNERVTHGSESPLSRFDVAKETDSPRFQALLRMTSRPRKGKATDIKSFSHELDPRGVRSYDFTLPHGLHDFGEVVTALEERFHKAKEGVNAELALFAGDLVEILEESPNMERHQKERMEDLLILARDCAYMDSQDFRWGCEVIVQELHDKRQELPMGVLKQLHTRMLFILTRCTRLLQFEKRNGLAEDGLHMLHQPENVGRSLEDLATARWKDSDKAPSKSVMPITLSPPPRSHIRESNLKCRIKDRSTPLDSRIRSGLSEKACGIMDSNRTLVDSLVADRLATWKRFSFAAGQEKKVNPESFDEKHGDAELKWKLQRRGVVHHKSISESGTDRSTRKSERENSSKRHQNISWGYWGDQSENLDDALDVICRICEDGVATLQLEDHSRVCAMADRCDQQGLGVDERLQRLAETLERLAESFTPRGYRVAPGGSPDIAKTSNSSNGGDSSDGTASEKYSSYSDKLAFSERNGTSLVKRGSDDILEDLHEIDTASMGDDSSWFNAVNCKTRFGPKVEQFTGSASWSAGSVLAAASSAGSLTPRSPFVTSRPRQFDILFSDWNYSAEADDIEEINELADIARCIVNTNTLDDGAAEYLVSCLRDLQDILRHVKSEALTVGTFGKRIEKLCKEKYYEVPEVLDSNDLDTGSAHGEEFVEDDFLRSLKSTPVHASFKDRTTIDDFEIIKPISRGAFGRVCLARKRTTGDLFAIKVLRKADMVRKNAVESVQAERNILISARNPFVVRFFYSFTCRENLYLVMEYLNGGDMYSMLRNLGCLEEDMARVYVAEIVLALEYLHSLDVVHRDLKPDNILVAHDGHIKLTDFGLSEVGLINSTDDFSGPAESETLLMDKVSKDQTPSQDHSQHRERRQQQSTVGTPDYLAPEILLGTSHGPAVDWWSTGVILFELLTGIPPFNAEHPQIIFDNILNRHIPWPAVPGYMSYEAQDLIDKLLTEDPNARLGRKGAAEVKAHSFFKDINWDTLARQKAAFIPNLDDAHDTSYFASRFTWNSTDGHRGDHPVFDSSDDENTGSACTSDSEEARDECGNMTEFGWTFPVKDSFSNFSFKNLSELASINYDLLQQTERKD